jgi:cellulose synthase/poly-beta-1,6-N-acetylglucosamine synthase-like glycosyltransferase
MTTVWTWVSALSCFAVLYTYILYPVFLGLCHWVRGRRVAPGVGQDRADRTLPLVSVAIAAYNEEAVLGAKLENLRATRYPADRIEFLVGSDGSTDTTNDILRAAEGGGLRAEYFERNRGKAAVLNDLVARARGEIVVFSDANTVYTPTTIGALVDGFEDPEVGGVCGELVLEVDARGMSGQGESWYWKYETAIKRWESNCGTLIGATGGVYAIRRSLYEPLDTSVPLTDDLLIALQIVRQGYRVIYSPDALAMEGTPDSVAQEFRRKSRIGAQNFNTLRFIGGLLHPRYGFAAFAFWSHKIVRWAVPVLLLTLLLSSALLARGSAVHLVVLLGGGVLGVLAAGGWLLDRLGLRLGVFGLPLYFVAVNAALFVGFIRFVMGTQPTTWTVERGRGKS